MAALLPNRAYDVFNPFDGGGAARGAAMGDAQQWGISIEKLLMSGRFGVESLAGMTALPKASLRDNDTLYVNATGVGGPFYWDADATDTPDGGTVFASDEGGAGRWKRRLDGPVWAHYYGAKGDGATDDTEALVAWLAGPGPWAILQPVVEYITNAPLVIAHEQIIECYGRVVIKAGSTFLGSALLKSKDFDSLTGTNKWLYSDGVPSGFGWRGYLRLDGSGNEIYGVQFYGKRFAVGEGEIHNCYMGGWYSECAYAGGQQSYRDMPENTPGVLWVRECAYGSGRVGVHYRGPHDGHIHALNLRGPTGDVGSIGLKVDQQVDVYGGTLDIDHVHVYGFTDNVDVSSSFKCSRVISESAHAAGAIFAAPTGQKIIVSQMEMYTNARSADVYSLQISGFGVTVDNLELTDDEGKGGVSLSGERHFVRGWIRGVNAQDNSIGLRTNQAGRCHIDVDVSGYSATGCIGWREAPTTACNHNHVQISLNNCTTGFALGTRGHGNHYHISGALVAGQTAHSGNRPRAGGLETVTCTIRVGSTPKLSHQEIVAANVVALDTTTEQTIVVPHNLYAMPYPEHVSGIIGGGSDVSDWGPPYIRVWDVSASDVTFRVRLSGASATAGALANLQLRAHV